MRLYLPGVMDVIEVMKARIFDYMMLCTRTRYISCLPIKLCNFHAGCNRLWFLFMLWLTYLNATYWKLINSTIQVYAISESKQDCLFISNLLSCFSLEIQPNIMNQWWPWSAQKNKVTTWVAFSITNMSTLTESGSPISITKPHADKTKLKFWNIAGR